jgi:DNA repair protein RadC
VQPQGVRAIDGECICSIKCSIATTVLIIHNHPSGDPTPSPDDHELTRRLAAAGVVMGIDLVDHIVLGDSRYCSFKEMGKL